MDGEWVGSLRENLILQLSSYLMGKSYKINKSPLGRFAIIATSSCCIGHVHLPVFPSAYIHGKRGFHWNNFRYI
jgi:hypothetical protein